ncbi:MAG: hypothetical protein EP344_15225 [Bacteroidetes bacterium]|nr:MAG: hypothetical protein EP344_15225 [Bacteroidota bacterium]
MKTIQYFRLPLASFLVLLMITTTLSCYSRRPLQKTRLSTYSLENKELIAIDAAAPESKMWLLSNVVMEDDALTAHFFKLSPDYIKNIASINTNIEKGANRNKVLLYVNPSTAQTFTDAFDARLEFSDLSKIEVFKSDGVKVTFAVIGGVIVLGALLLVIICNCPSVYTETPDGPQLAGELYSGAAYPQLERHDWLGLPLLEARDGQYAMTLTNDLYQNQHTNLLELEVLDGPPGTQPLYDKYGRLHTISAPQPPIDANDVSGNTVLDQVLYSEDGQIFQGDLNNQRADATERLSLRFPKPKGAQQAKLVLRAKTNFWLDYTFYEFQDELGVYGPKVREKYLKKSAAENMAWMERQKVPLAVSLETRPGRWEKVDYFNVVGSLVYRSDVLPIDLSGVEGDEVHLRLEYGFNFWEIDQVVLDYSPDVPLTRHRLQALSATTESGEDVAPALANDDDQYYDQPNIGDAAVLKFAEPPLQPGQVRNLILHAKGHYEIKFEPASGRPGYFELKRWEKENALPRLSRERWIEFRKLTLQDEKAQK